MRSPPRPRRVRVAVARSAPVSACLVPAAVLLLAAGGCRRDDAGASAPPPASVTAAHPLERQVVEWDEYTGRLEASETVDVRARVSGLVEATPFTDGALVKKGQTLFLIDRRPFDADLDKAKADVAKATAQVQQTTDELARIESLRPGGAASLKELLDARYNKQAADAAQAAAKANQRTAELNLEWTTVVAPIDGRVSRRLVTPGNLVNGGAGQATLLTTIVKYDPIYAYVDSEESAILKYQRLSHKHKRINARDEPIPCFMGLGDEPGFPHRGIVDFLDNRLSPGTGTLQARGSFPNPDARFTPGLFCRIHVEGSGRCKALLVPDQAIVADQGLRYVLVLGADNKAESRSVQPGPLYEGLRVVDGLKADDWVIVNGFQLVRPGQAVNATRGDMPLRHPVPDAVELTHDVPATQPAANQPSATRPTPGPAAPATAPVAGSGVAR